MLDKHDCHLAYVVKSKYRCGITELLSASVCWQNGAFYMSIGMFCWKQLDCTAELSTLALVDSSPLITRHRFQDVIYHMTAEWILFMEASGRTLRNTTGRILRNTTEACSQFFCEVIFKGTLQKQEGSRDRTAPLGGLNVLQSSCIPQWAALGTYCNV